MENEIWKPVPNFPLYEVSNLGRVKSLERKYERGEWRHQVTQSVTWQERYISGWVKRSRGRPMSVMIALRKDGITYNDRVHRLVLKAFVGPCPDGMEGCHNDGNPLNNALSNLRWDTHKSNVKDMEKHQTKSNPPVHFGEAHHNCKLTAEDVKAIRSTPITRGVKAELSRKYDVSITTIKRVLDGVQRPVL